MSDTLSLDRVSTLRFRPSREADDFLESYLRKSLAIGERYKAARLAIARSLQEPTVPAPLAKGTDMAVGIEGIHLFGEDKVLWVTLIASAWTAGPLTPDSFRAAVEAHWSRGADLLQRDLADVRHNDVDFALGVASLAGLAGPNEGESSATRRAISSASARLALRVGEVSIDLKGNSQLEYVVNAAGFPPHIALMGRTRSGKTRTGLEMLRQLTAASKAPFLFIDPKGDFVKDGSFVAKSEWNGRNFSDLFPGAMPIDVGRTPVPLDFLTAPAGSAPATLAQIAIAFRDSFQTCIRVKGDVALDNLREVVAGLLHARAMLNGTPLNKRAISLKDVRDAVRERNEEDRGKNSIEAKLNELVELDLFNPEQSPESFFGRSWVIGLGSTTPEAKKLVMFLLLDALAAYRIGQQDAPTDSSGHRAIQHVLVVDEAREILSYKHGALSQLLRKAGSKGELVMLLSQSPDDFDKEEDDFLSQMGTVGVFASTTHSVKSLRPIMGKKLNPEDFGDAALAKGVALVKLPGREPIKVVAWK